MFISVDIEPSVQNSHDICMFVEPELLFQPLDDFLNTLGVVFQRFLEMICELLSERGVLFKTVGKDHRRPLGCWISSKVLQLLPVF